MKTYRELVAWQHAMELAEAVCAAAACPSRSRLAFRARCVGLPCRSRPMFAEGQGLGSRKAFIRHLWIAHDSVRELETHVLLAERLRYLASGKVGPLLERLAAVGRLVRALIRGVAGIGPIVGDRWQPQASEGIMWVTIRQP